MSWILLRKKSICYEQAVNLAKQVEPEIAQMDDLFNEMMEVNRILSQIPDDVFDEDTVEQKWQKIFKVSRKLLELLHLFFRITIRCRVCTNLSVSSSQYNWRMHLWSESFLYAKLSGQMQGIYSG